MSGKEWHKWCYQKMKGDKGPVVREVKLQTCPECEEQIEEGQEKTVSVVCVRVCACVRLRHGAVGHVGAALTGGRCVDCVGQGVAQMVLPEDEGRQGPDCA